MPLLKDYINRLQNASMVYGFLHRYWESTVSDTMLSTADRDWGGLRRGLHT
jgi:hypothetical protein